MKAKIKAISAMLIFGVITLMLACDSNRRADETIAEVDRLIEQTTRETAAIEIKERYIYKRTEVTEEVSSDPETEPDSWTFINEPKQWNSTYMGVQCITDTTSAQWEWLQSHEWGYNDEGICAYDGRMLVALTPAFGAIGDYVDLLLSNGQILYCIIVDEKANSDTWGHWGEGGLNVIELIVSPEWYENGHDNIWYPDVLAFRNDSQGGV